MKRKFTVLVADRNADVRDCLRRELSAESYKIIIAESSERILEEIGRDDPPDLLILDFEIPGIGSAGIFEKAQGRNPPLPVIVHTFLTEESERDSPSRTEVYIKRSGNIDCLKSVVAEVLGRSRGQPGR